MARRRYSEKDVIRTLIHQGVEIRDFRTGELITLENVAQIEREHLHELKLDGPDDPANCRYSLKASHAVITNGPPATSAGSSKNRIAKATEPKRIAKFVVNKPPLDQRPTCSHCGLTDGACICAYLGGPRHPWPGRKFPAAQRKIPSRPMRRRA